MSGTRELYCAKIFRPDGVAERNFAICFEPVLRQENLTGKHMSILVDIQVGEEKAKPFILSGNNENFSFSSDHYAFFFRKTKSDESRPPSYEVYVGRRLAWVNKSGNQGLELLMREYTAIRQKAR